MSTSMPGRVTRHASWLELFYDLLFVALFAQLAHALVGDPGLATTLRVLALFAPAWWVWVSYTVSSNLYGEWGSVHRLLTLTSMACLLLMTGGVASALDGEPGLYAAGFAASRMALLVLVAVWQWRTPGAEPPRASYLCYSVSALLWLGSIPFGPPFGYVLWAAALAIELGVRMYEQVAAQRQHVARPWDIELLIERFGLLVIVALGEGVVQIAGAMSHTDPTAAMVASGLAGFAVLATLWWGYFDFASGAVAESFETAERRDEPGRGVYMLARDLFVFGHFFLVGAILVASAGIGALVGDAVSGDAATADLRLLVDALAAYLVTMAVLTIRLGGAWRRVAVAAAAVMVGLGVVALSANHFAPAAGLLTAAALLLAARLLAAD